MKFSFPSLSLSSVSKERLLSVPEKNSHFRNDSRVSSVEIDDFYHTYCRTYAYFYYPDSGANSKCNIHHFYDRKLYEMYNN